MASGSSWELADIAPRHTGEYTIRVRGFHVPPTFESWFGVARTTYYELC